MRNLLNLRLVSSKWRDSVDYFLQKVIQTACTQKYKGTDWMHIIFRHLQSKYYISPEGDQHSSNVHMIFQQARAETQLKIIGSCITIVQKNAKSSFSESDYVLRSFGNQVQVATVMLLADSFTSNYRTLQFTLKSLPNITALEMFWNENHSAFDSQGAIMEKEIRENPLDLSGLAKRLISLRTSHVPSSLLNHILYQLRKTLVYFEAVPLEGYDIVLDVAQLPDFQKLQSISLLASPRGTLKIIIQKPAANILKDRGRAYKRHFFRNSGCISGWKCILATINCHFRQNGNLRSIQIQLPATDNLLDMQAIIMGGAQLRLDAGNVEYVSVIVGSPCPLFDMLQPMKKSLKRIRIILAYDIPSEFFSCDLQYQIQFVQQATSQQQIGFIGFEQRMYSSTVWNVFQNLEEIHLEGYLDMFNASNAPIAGKRNCTFWLERSYYRRHCGRATTIQCSAQSDFCCALL